MTDIPDISPPGHTTDPSVTRAGEAILVAGVDEAGRGPLAGPVAVSAVILPANHRLTALDDSKRLSAKKREALAPQIKAIALAFSVIFVEPEEIDRVNILQATMIGMQRAIAQLNPSPDKALIDGNRAPVLDCQVETIIGGDGLVASISAASILAKVARDHRMQSLHLQYPDYGFDQHKGYPTALHREQLHACGPCPAHRRSFAPVKKALQQFTEQGL